MFLGTFASHFPHKQAANELSHRNEIQKRGLPPQTGSLQNPFRL